MEIEIKRLKEILKRAIIAYENELAMQDYETINSEHYALLLAFGMTEEEYKNIMEV